MLDLVSQQSKQKLKNVLESRLHGSRVIAFLSELFSNSGHFLFLKSLSDILIGGWLKYITEPSQYLLAAAVFVQAWYLSRPSPHRFWGNLIGVAIYTVIGLPMDGLGFFQSPSHIVFWLFSLVIATLQGIRFHWLKRSTRWIIPLETLTRTLMIVAFYLVIGIESNQSRVILNPIQKFTANPSNKFLFWSMVLLGLLLGLQTIQITKQRQQLQETSQVLSNFAEWGMGTHAGSVAVANPEDLDFQKRDRTIVFMSIRSFTSWCERTAPDHIATVLNDYYRSIEPAAAQEQPLRITCTGDEIMAIYATPEQGVAAAQSMQQAAQKTLTPYEIGARCAVHCGSVIEGLFGSEEDRTYTVIGNAINTAKRLESATAAGAITISDAVYQAIPDQLIVEPYKPIIVRGKRGKLRAWQLIDETSNLQASIPS